MVYKSLSKQGNLSDWMMPDHDAPHALDGLDVVVEWSSLEMLPAPIYASKTGRPGYPLHVLLRSLLLGAWYGLSDVKLEAQLVRDPLFRKFCGLSLNESAPDHSTLSRFRTQLVEKKLWEGLLAEVNRQLAAQHILLTQGQVSISDATVVEAHQAKPHRREDGGSTQDPDAGWHMKGKEGKKKCTYGYSIHVNCDEDGFIHKQTATPGEAHDSTRRENLMPGHESELHADSACAPAKTNADLQARGVRNNVQKKGSRHHPISAADTGRNKATGFTRGRVEAVFGSCKLHLGLRKTRFMGLLKNTTRFGLVAIIHNLRKAARFVGRYGLVSPVPQENCA